jgi:hypothetical protein
MDWEVLGTELRSNDCSVNSVSVFHTSLKWTVLPMFRKQNLLLSHAAKLPKQD